LYFALSIDNSDLVFASLIFEVVTVFLYSTIETVLYSSSFATSSFFSYVIVIHIFVSNNIN
jgi:hypothetical protein